MTSLLLMTHAVPTLTILGVLTALSIAAAVLVDVRAVIIAFMILCLVLPMVMAFVYFYHALAPATALNLLPHSLRVVDQTLEITLYQAVQSAAEEAQAPQSSEPEYEPECEPECEPEYEPFRTVSYPLRWMQRYTVGATYVVMPVRSDTRSYGWLYLPLSAFDSAAALKQFIDSVYSSPRP